MYERDIFLGAALVAFNVPVLMFARRLLNAVDFKHMVAEKDAAPIAAAPGAEDTSPVLVGSSARVASIMVSVVLCAFLWGVGDYVIYAAFFESDKIATFLGSVFNYFLSGMALYSPYGVNKLTSAFKS